MNDISEGSISRWGGEPFAPSRGATYRIHFNRRGASMLLNHSPKDGFQVGSVNGSWATTSRLESVEPLLWACANEGDKLSRCNSTDPKNDEDFMYVGYWYEEETGLYHIDPSLYYREDEYMDAIADARSLNQKAIWSFIQAAEVAVAPTPLQHFNEASEAPSEGSESPSMQNTIKQLAQRGYAVLRVHELEDLIQRNKEASERSRELRKDTDLGTRAVDDVVILDFEISNDEEVMSDGRHHLALDLETSKF